MAHPSHNKVLVTLAAGVGNIVLATPLLTALHEMGFETDVWLAADYPQTIDLLRPWKLVHEIFTGFTVMPACNSYTWIIPAIPPFYWSRFATRLAGTTNLIARPPQSLFYEDEQEYYLSFARRLGYSAARKPCYALPISPDNSFGVGSQTLVLAPGCKTGEMAAKRWPHFPALADAFADVAIAGTADDLRDSNGAPFNFSSHVRSYVDQLTLRQTAELLASAGCVVANDSGLAHVAAAVGVPTVIIFGPTPHQTIGPFMDNVAVLRQRLPCEPCWFQSRFQACNHRITCLETLRVETIVGEIERKSLLRSSAYCLT